MIRDKLGKIFYRSHLLTKIAFVTEQEFRAKSICFCYQNKKNMGDACSFYLKNYTLELNIIVFRLKTKILWTKARTFQLRTS